MSSRRAQQGREKIWTPSNIVTITRILLVPVFVAALLCPWPEWIGVSEIVNDWKRPIAAAIFVLISCTDWLDGYLARSRNEVTDFGKFMDPLADKILVAASLVALVELNALPTWVVLVILAREFIVSGVRMMAASKGVVIAASWLGKFKTVFQMAAIVLFTIKGSHTVGGFDEALDDTLWVVSWLVMIVALGLTVASLVDYLYKARDIIGLGDGSSSQGVATITAAEPQAAAQPGSPSRAAELVRKCLDANATVCTAESLTGGLIGASITSVPGSSEVFKGGILSYVNEVKRDVLGVEADVLRDFGAVSEQCALQMARGARRCIGADYAVAVTGIAGPGGAEPGKPVGTVWIAVASSDSCAAKVFHFEGTREEVRAQTVTQAVEALIVELERQTT